jgi:hypothetical protein
MPRKSVKKIMKELMAKKKLTAKEKKLLMKIQKGGGWFDWLGFGPAKPATAETDPAKMTELVDKMKNTVCETCKAAFGPDGCKCGNTAPPAQEPESNSVNAPVTPLSQPPSDGDNNPGQTEENYLQEEQQQEQKQNGGRRKSGKRKNKRSRKTSKKMKW